MKKLENYPPAYISYTPYGKDVENILNIKSIAPNFFEIKDWKIKENINKIEKGIIPLHKYQANNKVDLINILRKEGNLYLTHTNILDIIRNNNIPYMNYQNLQKILKSLDQKTSNKIEIFDNLENSFLHCLCLSKENINFVMVNEGDYYILYSNGELKENHPDPETYMPKQESDYGFENKIIYHLFKEKPENIINKQIPFAVKDKIKSIDYFNMLDNYIIENNNPKFDIILGGHLYTRKEKILNKFIDVEITYTSTNLVKIYVTYNRKIKSLTNNFYLPKDLEDSMISCIKLLWSNGYLLTDYGYNYYVQYGKILTKSIYSPWWLQSSNKNEIKNLIKFINQLKDDN